MQPNGERGSPDLWWQGNHQDQGERACFFFFFALTATVDDGGKHRAIFSSIWEEVLFCGCLQLLYGHVTAEAVLGDLGVRQALKDMPNNVRL